MSPPPRWLTNSARLQPVADELRPAAAQVGVDRARGGRADRDEPLLGALAARAQDAGLEVDVAESRARSPPTRAARRRTSAPAARGRAARAARCRAAARAARPTSSRVSTCGSRRLCLGARRSTVGSSVEQVLAAQVAVERAQAGDLALQRRGRDRRAVLAAPAARSETKSARSPCRAVSASAPVVRRNAPNCSRSER